MVAVSWKNRILPHKINGFYWFYLIFCWAVALLCVFTSLIYCSYLCERQKCSAHNQPITQCPENGLNKFNFELRRVLFDGDTASAMQGKFPKRVRYNGMDKLWNFRIHITLCYSFCDFASNLYVREKNLMRLPVTIEFHHALALLSCLPKKVCFVNKRCMLRHNM